MDNRVCPDGWGRHGSKVSLSSLTHQTSLIVWGKGLSRLSKIETSLTSSAPPRSDSSPGFWNLPVYFIHGQATPPQPAVAAVAHEGQDGIFPRDGFHHGLQVEQVAVCCRQDCKRTKDAVCSLPCPSGCPPHTQGQGNGGGRQAEREEGSDIQSRHSPRSYIKPCGPEKIVIVTITPRTSRHLSGAVLGPVHTLSHPVLTAA